MSPFADSATIDGRIRLPRSVGTTFGTRFFTDADSAAIRDVYDYYALVQAEAAFALAFSWYAEPATYSQQTIDNFCCTNLDLVFYASNFARTKTLGHNAA